MNELRPDIQVGTAIQVEGVKGWLIVSDILASRKTFAIKGIRGYRTAGAIIKYSNSSVAKAYAGERT